MSSYLCDPVADADRYFREQEEHFERCCIEFRKSRGLSVVNFDEITCEFDCPLFDECPCRGME